MKFPARFLLASACLLGCDPDAGDGREAQSRFDKLDAQIEALHATVATLDARLLACESVGQAERASLKASVDAMASLVDLAPFVSVEGTDIIVRGANLHVRNGEGATDTTDGTGNLVIGYNEGDDWDLDRGGSHNIVNGPYHAYSSYGGYVGGRNATIAGPYAVVLTGSRGSASGQEAVVLTGHQNSAEGWGAVVATGQFNVASGGKSLVGTGDQNTVSGAMSLLLVGERDVLAETLAVRVGNERDGME